MTAHWPAHLPTSAVRIARPTERLEACLRFYRDALGLTSLASFRGHAGYDGEILGLPDDRVQLELTHQDGEPVPAASPENQLVLYLADVTAAAERLRAHGTPEVEPANPYWRDAGAQAFTDPDGWVVLLVPAGRPISAG